MGLLADGPKSGYDLKRNFDQSAGHAWNANSSQIYPALRELETSGMIRSLPQDPGSRRSEYELTEAGRGALNAWLREPVERRTRRDPFLLRVFFLDLLPPVEQHRQLVRFVEEQERFLGMCDRYRIGGASASPKVQWRLSSMEVAAAAARAQRDWVEHRIAALADEDDQVAALERARRTLRDQTLDD